MEVFQNHCDQIDLFGGEEEREGEVKDKRTTEGLSETL